VLPLVEPAFAAARKVVEFCQRLDQQVEQQVAHAKKLVEQVHDEHVHWQVGQYGSVLVAQMLVAFYYVHIVNNHSLLAF